MSQFLVLGRWSPNVTASDLGLKQYIHLEPKLVLSTQGRHVKKAFGKRELHIVERLINNLMRGGTGEKIGGKVIRGRGGTGKKVKMYNIVREAFARIEKKSGSNPIELLIKAIESSAPREETTRVQYGGIIVPIAVDVSPQRRLDLALRNIARAVAIRSFNSRKKSTEALAEEIMLAAQNDASSHAIARKVEVERIARSSR
ncbi:30S ribosomal protein S7 [archaeon]|nr:30S ribosomal protein S7 [archaeon]